MVVVDVISHAAMQRFMAAKAISILFSEVYSLIEKQNVGLMDIQVNVDVWFRVYGAVWLFVIPSWKKKTYR